MLCHLLQFAVILWLSVGLVTVVNAKDSQKQPPREASSDVRQLNVEYSKIRAKKNLLDKEQKDLQIEIRNLENQIRNSHSQAKPDIWDHIFRTGPIDKRAIHRNYRKTSSLQRKLTEQKRKLSEINQQLEGWNSEAKIFTLAAQKFENIEQATRVGFAGVSQQLKGSELSLKLGRMSQDYIKMDSDLDNIVNQIDKTAIGAYFQDKIGLLLNSSAICSARKRCVLPSDVEKPIPNHQIISELFPESSPAAHRQQSYYKNLKEKKQKQEKAK